MAENDPDTDGAQERALLRKIQGGGIPLREIENGRPYNLLKTAVKQSVPSEREDGIQPPSYGYGSLGGFLNTMIAFLPSSDIWILGIFISELMEWYWEETQGKGEGSLADSASDFLGTLPIAEPHPDDRRRLVCLVNKIVCEADGSPSQIEFKSDLEDRVLSIYALTCTEIGLALGSDAEW